MIEQEGDKPHLSIVPSVDPLTTSSVDQDYGEVVAGIIATLSSAQIKGDILDLTGALRVLDPQQDNSGLREFLAKNDMMPRTAFDRQLAGIQRNRTLSDELGFVPSNALEYVRGYATKHKVRMDARGVLTRSCRVKLADDCWIDETNCDQSASVRLLWDVHNATDADLDSFARELRLENDRLKLGFRDSIIGDAVSTWRAEGVRQIKADALAGVAFSGYSEDGVKADMWRAVEKACFDVTSTRPGFAIAVLRKFIWQVKRKARNFPITNHLMPVIYGKQGGGKTEFVRALTRPLLELMRGVDFKLLTDGKTKDIWSSLILFLDEMGWVNRAAMEDVKNVITADTITIRTMRSNDSTTIKNDATLIGCSNKSLGMLIRDETGLRRFAELTWRSDPDWEASNRVDWSLLWQSVDERDEDPIVTAGMTDMLLEQQESNRSQNPVEVWAREVGDRLTGWTRSSELHVQYRDWEEEAFPRQDTNQITFGKTLTHLCEMIPDFPFEFKSSNKGKVYRSKP